MKSRLHIQYLAVLFTSKNGMHFSHLWVHGAPWHIGRSGKENEDNCLKTAQCFNALSGQLPTRQFWSKNVSVLFARNSEHQPPFFK